MTTTSQTQDSNRIPSRRALTLGELLVVVVILFILASVLLPSIVGRRHTAHPRINCMNNLKQIWIGFELFATDHNGKFPAMLSTNEGGLKELLNAGPGGAGDPTLTFRVFTCMSNEFNTPKVILCPADQQRERMSNFFGLDSRTIAEGGQNAAVSYFVNLDAQETQTNAILAGDRNLSTVTNASHARDYDAFFSVEHRIRPADVKPGSAYGNLEFQKSLHFDRSTGIRRGNVVLADGSVEFRSGARVRKLISASTNDHRLIYPFVLGKNE